MKRAIGLLLVFVACIAGFMTAKGIFPIIPVSGNNMEPALPSGSLLTIKPVNPETIKVGDIIIYNVSAAMQDYYNYPPVVVHRVIEIKTAPSLSFRTKGDNAGEDPFTIKPIDIRGTVGKQIPYLGEPFLLFQNQQGLILVIIALVLLTVLLYSREIIRGGIALHRKILPPLTPEEKPDKLTLTRKIETAENKIDTVEPAPEKPAAAIPEYPPPRPKKDTKKKSKPIPAAPPSPKSPGHDRKREELTEEGLAAEKEIFDALDRLGSKPDKPKDQV